MSSFSLPFLPARGGVASCSNSSSATSASSSTQPGTRCGVRSTRDTGVRALSATAVSVSASTTSTRGLSVDHRPRRSSAFSTAVSHRPLLIPSRSHSTGHIVAHRSRKVRALGQIKARTRENPGNFEKKNQQTKKEVVFFSFSTSFSAFFLSLSSATTTTSNTLPGLRGVHARRVRGSGTLSFGDDGVPSSFDIV
jgi:hypothetical protein